MPRSIRIPWRPVLGVAAAFVLVGLGWAQGDPKALAQILDEGKNRNQVMLHLRHLTKKIGPRLLGSKNLQAACDWTMKKMADWGLKNVHFEPYMEVPIGFDRGERQIARMVAPVQRDFEFSTSAWSAGTRGLVRGRAVLEPKTQDELAKVKERLKGAWVISTAAGVGLRSGPDTGDADLRKAVSDCGIAGRVYASDSELVHTGGNFRNLTPTTLPTEPRVQIRASDMKALREVVDAGKEATLEFDIDNRFNLKPVQVGNVIGEIPGTQQPDEVVIISGHLDSWDGPGSEGACDNGTGSMAVMEAARILAKFGVKPRRTIRFALWTGEEEGLLGSHAYVEKHKDEMSKISAVFVDDNGTNYESGLSCSEAAAPFFASSIEAMNKAFPDMPETVNVFQPSTTGARPRRGGGGSDHASFNAVGVPGFFMRKAGKANYMTIWHTQNDRFEQVVPEYMRQVSTNLAVISYNLACAEKTLPR